MAIWKGLIRDVGTGGEGRVGGEEKMLESCGGGECLRVCEFEGF